MQHHDKQGKIRVGLVEDQYLFREGMKAILKNWPDIEVVFESEDGYSVVDKLMCIEDIPEVMLVDMSLPSQGNREFNGLDLTIALTVAYPAMKILVLSVHDDENFINQMIANGAHGYLVKDCDPQEVYEAIVSAHCRGSYINSRALRAIQNNRGRKPVQKKINVELTRREEEILALVCQQFTTEEIAEKLFISFKTVNGHRNNLLLKTGSRNVTGLVLYAIKNNIVKVI
jgi:DNA-binding NarL/FixJ family response regulator